EGLGEFRRVGVRGDVAADRDGEDRLPLRVGVQAVGVDVAGVQTVLDVVHRVGHVVGPVHDLRLEADAGAGGVLAEPVEDRAVVVVHPELRRGRVGGVGAPRPGVLGGGVQRGAGEVQADAGDVAGGGVGDEALGFDPGE